MAPAPSSPPPSTSSASAPAQALPPRVLRSTPIASPVGSGLRLVPNGALADAEKWTGRADMAGPIAKAAMSAGARFAGLRVVPDPPDGSETVVRVGDLLGPSLRHDARGAPTGGLHRGTSVIGFRDQESLLRAIAAIAFFGGRQVVLVSGTASHRTEEDAEERIIVGARVLAVWYRKFSGAGRGATWPPDDHADW